MINARSFQAVLVFRQGSPVLFSLDPRRAMRQNISCIFAFVICSLGVGDAIAGSSTSSRADDEVALTRDNWLAAFKAKDVNAAVGFYASEAAFLQPTGERIEGIEAIRELYQKVVTTFDTDLVVRSRHLEVSTDLAFDSGEYEETMTDRTSARKQHFHGQYVMVLRRNDGHWKIIQHVWTVSSNRG